MRLIPAILVPLFAHLGAATLIQFGGDKEIVGDTQFQSQIGASEIISWTGANSAGGGIGASGIMGGSAGQGPGAVLRSLGNDPVTMTSVAIAGGTATHSSGTPNVLGVGPTIANAKFDASASEAWTFHFDRDVILRKFVFSALNNDSETVELMVTDSLTASFTRTDSQMAAVTYGDSNSARFVYTLEGDGLAISSGTSIRLRATSGQWGLQAVVVEFAPSEPPPPPGFEPNPDGGLEAPPLSALDPVPNVIIFLADDMGIGDSSAYQDLTGNPDEEQIDTPEMERLADLGTRFTDAHTNGATCSPSRISLLSGIYSFRSPLKIKAVQDSDQTHGVILPGRRLTMAHMLQRAGYRTYGYGKWHMALRGDAGEDTNDDGVVDVPGTGILYEGPIESGFDTYLGTPGNFSYAGAMIQDKHYMRFGSSAPDDYTLVPINDPSAVAWDGRGPASPTDPNLYKVQPAVFGKLQADLKGHMRSRSAEPFFVYYASHSNHDPYVPANYQPDHPRGPRASLNGRVIDTAVTKAGDLIRIVTGPDNNADGLPDPDYGYYETHGGWIWNDALREKWWDHVTEVDQDGHILINGPTNRAMMVQENDIIIGYLLDFLEHTDDPRNPGHKLIDNTIFIFTSDNGADIRSEAAVGALPQSSDSVITDISGFKGTRWEGGNRVPFIAAWPEPGDHSQDPIPARNTSSAIFGLNDIYATIAEIIGHRLQPDEAVDSESLLGAWTRNDQGTVRSTDLLYKYEQRVFSRRGELKLAALDDDYTGGSNDRFANSNNLDFDDMVFDSGWKTRILVDLSNDLSENTNLGATATAADMLETMNTLTSQGFSRTGGSAFENGRNFKGGDLLAATNWHTYNTARNNVLPSGRAPGIIAEDGTAGGDLNNLMLVHRAGTLEHRPGATGALSGSHYELDGGTLISDDDFRMRNARLTIHRGTAALGPHTLALNGADCVVILSGGTIDAARLSLGENPGATDGFKIVRFKGNDGTLHLDGNDPIGFGDDGSPGNDFIDFVTGCRGRLVTTRDAGYFGALWDAGRLRIDGVAGTTGGFASSPFVLLELGDGYRALVLDVGQRLDFDADGINDLWEQRKAGAVNLLSLNGDFDHDGILDAKEYLFDYNPLMASPPFEANLMVNPATRLFEIRFASKASRRYLVHYSPDLSAPDQWEELSREMGINGLSEVVHDAAIEQGWYRVDVYLP